MAFRLRTAALLAAAAAAACAPANPKAKGATPFDQLTLQNLVVWPDGREYMTATGVGHPTYGEKNVDKRRQKAREDASTEAQTKLIAQLEAVAPRSKVRGLLREAEVGKLDYGYDDTCTMVLRIPKEAITGAVSEPLR